MPSEKKPLVSIVMIAYNVEKFISAAIESVLAQKVNFTYELVIGEDCSTDRTRQIALNFQREHPDKIKVLYHKKNLGLTPNCVATHNACTGKYIALLDADDFWTNTRKLQIQIDFLESHPNYAGCAHQCLKIYEADYQKPAAFGEQLNRDYILLDMIGHRKFHTSSFVYRKSIWDTCGGIPKDISSNERAIYPMVALFGKIRYIKETMGVYRLTGQGLSSRVNYKELETDFQMIPWLKQINPAFPASRFKSFLHQCNYTYGVGAIPLRSLVKHYLMTVFYSMSYFPRNLGHVKWSTIFFIQKLKQR